MGESLDAPVFILSLMNQMIFWKKVENGVDFKVSNALAQRREFSDIKPVFNVGNEYGKANLVSTYK
jgi:hypothetical protein